MEFQLDDTAYKESLRRAEDLVLRQARGEADSFNSEPPLVRANLGPMFKRARIARIKAKQVEEKSPTFTRQTQELTLEQLTEYITQVMSTYPVDENYVMLLRMFHATVKDGDRLEYVTYTSHGTKGVCVNRITPDGKIHNIQIQES